MDTTRLFQADPDRRGTDVDVAIAGDFRVASEAAFRTLNQTLIQTRSGYRTGLLHVPCASSRVFPFINPEIDRLVRNGQARAIDPSSPVVNTRLLLIESATDLCERMLEGRPPALPRILADRVIALLDTGVSAARLRKYNAIIGALFGAGVTWSATSAEARTSLSLAELTGEPAIWGVSVSLDGGPVSLRSGRAATVLGRTTFGGTDDWPSSDSAQFSDAYPSGEGRLMRVLALPWLGKSSIQPPEEWHVTSLRSASSAAFLRRLDYFVYYPGNEDAELPVSAMAWAMAHGIPVIADPALRGRLGKGPIYAEPEDVAALVDDKAAHDARSENSITFARQHFGPHIHLQRLEELIGPPKLQRPRLAARAQKKRVLFTCTNGIGIGHVTRLLAVARNMPDDVVPVFATLNPTTHLVRQAGYPVEYIVSSGTAMCDPDAWNQWYRDELIRIMDFHDVRAVMFDGGRPFNGLIAALRARPEARSAWMRRGLWQEHQVNAPFIARQHHFDLVIEPGDIAESSDKGETVINRDMALKVDPIQLINEDELLDREEAAKRIGLDPARPACLLQLGSGTNRDQLSLLDGAVAALRGVEGMQIVLTRWPIATHDLDFWPDTICLRGFPTSKYYRAFDFTISATGYNSFHEIINFGLPAIFLANTHMALDDQVARAAFAQDNDAGFHLPDSRIDAVGALIESIMDESVRTIIESNCRRLSRPNGAAQAADAFAELVV